MYALFIGISWIQLTVSIPHFLFMTKTDKTGREHHKNRVVGVCGHFLWVVLSQYFKIHQKEHTKCAFES